MAEGARRRVVALGGNALVRPGQRGSGDEQIANLTAIVGPLADAIAAGDQLVLIHGNGPQVGNLLIQNEIAAAEVPAMPLDVCVAETQGVIGYLIQQTLGCELWRRGLRPMVRPVITRVLVDPGDPAWQRPTKPIGPYYSGRVARARTKHGETWAQEGARGWRRLVPSPEPVEIVEADTIRLLADDGAVVVACGGGGIPVVAQTDGTLKGVEAVVDKDLTAHLLAAVVGADELMVLTNVEQVAVRFGRPDQAWLDRVSAAELRKHQTAGEFPRGSMGPKVEAVLRFVERGGRRGVIASLDRLGEALTGRSGTTVVGEAEAGDVACRP